MHLEAASWEFAKLAGLRLALLDVVAPAPTLFGGIGVWPTAFGGIALWLTLLGLLADPQPAITNTPDTMTTAIGAR